MSTNLIHSLSLGLSLLQPDWSTYNNTDRFTVNAQTRNTGSIKKRYKSVCFNNGQPLCSRIFMDLLPTGACVDQNSFTSHLKWFDAAHKPKVASWWMNVALGCILDYTDYINLGEEDAQEPTELHRKMLVKGNTWNKRVWLVNSCKFLCEMQQGCPRLHRVGSDHIAQSFPLKRSAMGQIT